ncbi:MULTISPECIES: hypothetical protein [unclassified Agrobacterium]|jgi:hypothetical protein|uniref:hypothetical protein n=1 Tax=unclassified Agrobacterium TaxID=2632611 RepID=UPI0023D89743|nr:hypothetical protein [Agrobacterium sp. Azo12]MDO5898444.1 hypothetical protein [Agrobacterium sp. Azo12]
MTRYRIMMILIGPLLLWAMFFSLFYAVQSVGCRAGWDLVLWGDISQLRVLIVAVLGLALIVSAYAYFAVIKSEAASGGINRIGRYCAIAGMASTVLVFPGIFWLQLC